MENVLLVIHLLLALAIIGLVLIQRSEGGGLGMGGSGGGLGNFATPRATANILTRATAWCAAAFFLTSLVLGILAGTHSRGGGILETYGGDRAAQEAPQNIDGDTPGKAAAPSSPSQTPPKPVETPAPPSAPVGD